MEVKIFEYQMYSKPKYGAPEPLLAIKPTADNPEEQAILNLMGAYGDPAVQRQELILFWRWRAVSDSGPIYASLETAANYKDREVSISALRRVYLYLVAHWDQLPSGSILNLHFIDNDGQGVYQGKSYFSLITLPPMPQPPNTEDA